MSDRAPTLRTCLAALLLAATVAAPRPAGAQSVAQLRTRLLATSRRSAVFKDSLKILHELRSTDLPADSLAAGPLKFRFLKSNFGTGLQAMLQAAATHAMSVADSMFGDAVHDVAAGAPILATRANTKYGQLATVDIVTLELADGGGRTTLSRAPVTQRKLEEAILDLLGTMATRRVPAQVLRWGGEWIPSRRLTSEIRENAAVDLASSSSIVARTCYSGSVPACESALGLTDVHDALTEWYSPEGWRALVSTWKPLKTEYSIIADRAECLEKKVTAVCERLSRGRPVPYPLSVSTRQTLLGLALELGGRPAYARLTSAKGTPLEILSAVAGVAPDSLIREWRTRVMAASPKSASPSPSQAAVFAAWIVVFGFAAGRRRP
jgi:hypothetical protein